MIIDYARETLSRTEQRLLGILQNRTETGERVPMPFGDTAKELCVSRDTIRRTLRSLESKGLVRVDRGHGRSHVTHVEVLGE